MIVKLKIFRYTIYNILPLKNKDNIIRLGCLLIVSTEMT